MKQLIDDFKKIKWTRATIELLVVAFLIILALSTFLTPFKHKGVLHYDHHKITYQGDVANNRMNGQGKLTYANGDTYSGQFKNGLFSGQGTYKAAKGWSYTGEFKKGQADGRGTLKTNTGKTYKGQFKQGIYQK